MFEFLEFMGSLIGEDRNPYGIMLFGILIYVAIGIIYGLILILVVAADDFRCKLIDARAAWAAWNSRRFGRRARRAARVSRKA